MTLKHKAVAFILAIAALSGMAEPAAPIQSYDTYKSWLVACDNTLHCLAKGFDPGATRSDMKIERDPGPAGQITLTIASEERFTLSSLSVDGRQQVLNAADWTVTSHADGTTITTTRPSAVGTLLKTLRGGGMLALGGGVAAIPLEGLTAALLRIDDRQGRAGSVTALVRTGPQSAVSVPTAPSLPKVPARPIAARLSQAEARKLIAAVRGQQRTAFVKEQCEDDTSPMTAEAFALDANRALVLIPCLLGAYQGSSLAFVTPRVGGGAYRVIAPAPYLGNDPERVVADMFTEAGFDPGTGSLSMSAKGRGIGDCGMAASWIWDGHAFQLAELALQQACGGYASGDWPIVFKSRQ